MKNQKSKQTILGIDPGTKYFAYAVLHGKRIKHTGWISPYTKCANNWELARTITDLRGVIDKYKPDLIVCERFVHRGKVSTRSEILNQVLGSMIVLFSLLQIKYKFIMPSSWKNYATKHWGYDSKIKSKSGTLALTEKIFPYLELNIIHFLDAACIARYSLEKDFINEKDL